MVVAATGTVPIEAIEPDDLVLAQSHMSGEQTFKLVVRTFVKKTEELVHLKVADETITTTPEHPFRVEGEWVPAAELTPGTVVTLMGGSQSSILSVVREHLASPRDVYNFEVEDFHTYFVASAGVWVHNSCVARNRAWGSRVENAVRSGIKRSFKTKLGMRHVDDYFERGGSRDAREIKSGRVRNTRHFRQQVRKDLRLLREGHADEIEWVNRVGRTGQKGYSRSAERYLRRAQRAANRSGYGFSYR